MEFCILAGTLSTVLSSFAGTFGRPTFRTFASLVIGWVLCTGRHTISGAILAARGSGAAGHHARFYRLLSKARWRGGPDALGRAVLERLLPLLPRCIEVIIDDTLCHRTGPQIFGTAMHYDGVASSYSGAKGARPVLSYGHDWVVLAVRVPLPWARGRGIAVPLLARLYRGVSRCPASEYRKRTELAREMLDLLLTWLPADRSVRLLGDSEYSCRTLVRDLPARVTFIGPALMDAALHEPPPAYRGRGRPPKVGRRLPSPELLAAARPARWTETTVEIYGRPVRLLVCTLLCLWPTVAGSRLVRVVVTRDPRRRFKDRAFFATDPDLSVAEILTAFSHRWDLEVTFRDLKQILGLEQPQNGWWRRAAGERPGRRHAGPAAPRVRSRAAVGRTVPLVLAVHGIVVLWYMQHGHASRDVRNVRTRAPWRCRKTAPSFADMVAALRAEILRSRRSAHPLPERVREEVLRFVLPLCGAAA
jgi:hypothetical protein